MPRDQKFEVPQELRHLADENVERARQLYVQFMDWVGQAMATWSSASSGVVCLSDTRVRAANGKGIKRDPRPPIDGPIMARGRLRTNDSVQYPLIMRNVWVTA
jgi:hypothetical protein